MINSPQSSSFFPATLNSRVDESVRWRIRMEKRIARSLIIELLGQGFSLSVHDGDEFTLKKSKNRMDILYSMATTDEDYLYVADKKGVHFGWVRFIYGEDGWDVINDSTVNLEPFMTKTQALIDKLMEKAYPTVAQRS